MQHTHTEDSDHDQFIQELEEIEDASRRALLMRAWELIREKHECRMALTETEYAFSKIEFLLELEKELDSQLKPDMID